MRTTAYGSPEIGVELPQDQNGTIGGLFPAPTTLSAKTWNGTEQSIGIWHENLIWFTKQEPIAYHIFTIINAYFLEWNDNKFNGKNAPSKFQHPI